MRRQCSMWAKRDDNSCKQPGISGYNTSKCVDNCPFNKLVAETPEDVEELKKREKKRVSYR